MKVKELINILERYGDDTEVVFSAENTNYVDTIYNARIGTVRAFFGKDYQAVILDGNQVGAAD